MNNCNNKKRFLGLFFLILIMSTISVYAIDEGTIAFGDDTSVKNEVAKQHLQTRAEIKKYIDTKSDALVQEVEKKAQNFIDENFLVLDTRMRLLINGILLKAMIGIVACIVFSQLIWFFIKKKIDSIRRKKDLVEQLSSTKELKGKKK